MHAATMMRPVRFSSRSLHLCHNAPIRVALRHDVSIIRPPQQRHASSSAEPQKKQPQQPSPQPTSAPVNSAASIRAVTTPLDATTPRPRPLSPSVPLSETLNPPASTRPPPLDIPTRDPSVSLISHLFKTGKAYLTFYKTGLKAILTNRRLVQQLARDQLAKPPGLRGAAVDTTVKPTRAAVLLRERTRHDVGRLPVFGLVLLVFGEWTPLVIMFVPQLSPYTCRIPRQVAGLRRAAAMRRAESYRKLRHVHDEAALERVADGHVARVLGLGSRVWDFQGDVPFAGSRARRALDGIVGDDFMIRDGGGAGGLVDEEVMLAAEARGVDVSDRTPRELRVWLGRWIERTTKGSEDEGRKAAKWLILRPESIELKAKS